MSYIGNVPTTAAFPFDQFSGNGSTTAFTLSTAPAGTTSILVTISGVTQNPNVYSVAATTLTFNTAPAVGTNNIAVLYLGLPAIVGSPISITNGGTGQTTRQDAMDALAGSTTSGSYLRGNGTDVVMATIQAADVPTLNQNTTGNAATVTTNANLTGDVTSVGNAATVVKINGTTMSALATGILKNTTTTGVPSIAVAADFPTLNQNTTGSAATLTTGRTIAITGDLAYTSGSFNGSGNVTGTGTLATVNANVGSFTAASITVNAKGLITAASSGSSGGVTSITAGSGLTGGTITSTGTIAIDIYTGSTQNNSSYPIGTTIACGVGYSGVGGVVVAASQTIWSPSTGSYQWNFSTSSAGSGSSQLSGTWRSRGQCALDDGSTRYYLFQRTA